MKRVVYREIASRVNAMNRCQKWANDPSRAIATADPQHWREMVETHKQRIKELIVQFMPSGSGIDCGTMLDFSRSHGERLVFVVSFHHMDDGGGYDGWTEHNVTVTPSLVFGFSLGISGRNRNDIKEYLSQTYHAALTTEFDE